MADFKEHLLRIMDQKNHWGWDIIKGPGLTKDQLLVHFQQEYEVYVRDFPVFLARVMGRMPAEVSQLKREFAENIFEEQTGGLSKKVSGGSSHPELFVKMMRGLGYAKKDFEDIQLSPTSFAYRSFLDLVTLNYEWSVAAAVLTLFVEGSIEDRARLKKNYKPVQTLNHKLKNHSLHKHYGLKTSHMDLIKVHHVVEGGHRKSAWETVLKIIPGNLKNESLDAMAHALELWYLFRDGVCIEMGIEDREFRRLAQAPLRH